MSFCVFNPDYECLECGACMTNDDLTEEDLELLKDLNSIN